MKKIISVLLSAVIMLSIFGACGKEEDVNWIASFEYEQGYSWIYNMEKEGVISLLTRGDSPEADGKTGNTMFIFQPVGEGETVVTFSYLANSGEVIKKVKYKVTVDADYKYVAELIEDNVDVVQTPVKIENQEEAEKYLSDKVGAYDEESGNEFVVEFERSYEEDGVRWYVFRVSTVINENGKTYLRFFKLYAVSRYGEVKELEDPEDVTDRELSSK